MRVTSAGEGLWVAAKSSRGTLAHAIYVKDLQVFDRRHHVLARCFRAEPNVLLSDGFDLDAKEHAGHRTCQACVQGVRESEATMRFLKEYEERDSA